MATDDAATPDNGRKGSLPDVAAVAEWIHTFRTLVAETTTAWTELQDRLSRRQRDLQRDHDQARQKLVAEFSAEENSLLTSQQNEQLKSASHWTQQLDQLARSTEKSMIEVQEHFDAELAAAKASREETTWLVASLLDEESSDSPRQQLNRLHVQLDGAESVLQDAVRSAETLRIEAAEYLERCRLSTEVGALEPAPPPTRLDALQEKCLEEVELAREPYRKLMRLWLPRCFLGARPFLIWLMLAALLAGPSWFLLDPSTIGVHTHADDPVWKTIIVLSGSALAFVFMFFLHLAANQQAFGLITDVFVHSRAAQALFGRWARLASEELASAQQELDRRHSRQKTQREDAFQKAAQEFAERTAELKAWRAQSLERIQSAAQSKKVLLEQSRDQQLSFLTMAGSHERQTFVERREQASQELETAARRSFTELEQTRRHDSAQIIERWKRDLDQLHLRARDWQRQSQALFPDWSTPDRDRGRMSHPALLTGTFRFDAQLLPPPPPPSQFPLPEQTWVLPLTVNLARQSSLLLQYGEGRGRETALDLLRVGLLQLLTSLPPGQVRVTILDPVSLGENFATFMHLADADELLITSRIWTEPGQIEERLADLTEHMETVLQMYLRNEFASLDDYNREAAEVAEPYRILVVSGLPANFSDLALRRLWNIVASGRRCGVFTLVAADLRVPLPRPYKFEDWSQVATRAVCEGERVRWDHPELEDCPFEPLALPDDSVMAPLVKEIARTAGDVRRVEVPFQRVAPSPDLIWTRSAARTLDIPIGRAGAKRNQAVTLGVGTSQHVLIAGKTGSGKSSLLHALITNAALHYSPDELEFYLIDFKKGVEFKVYARQRLPHARVIGIESDREFGVSTLERLDRILQERSVLFRDAGVSDLSGYRRARADQPMPRILLVVDEFQEFFVDDDPLAQTAALLLDRLVRQGRAFGVHVVLGSQTLAGAYSLARSTLGQIAVRIALQCSDADAHLILSEDNTAARLLTRPGEAIYNDANGLASGNHRFQVVWLGDDERDEWLQLIATRSKVAVTPPIVFEGNLPADLRSLPPSTASTSRIPVTWLGESVSLKGPLGLEFPLAAGSHLLIVGQEESAACGVMTAMILSMAQMPDQTLVLCNGSPQEESVQSWEALASRGGHLENPGAETLPGLLSSWAEEIRRRDGRPGPRRWLFLFDLVRFRALRRKDDDFGFGSLDKKSASPSDLLAEVLRDGPTVGIHVVLWCDSMNTVSRWLSREMQGHLENRVALPMNATDSSQLIDSPAASRLGTHRAWLYRGDRGTLDKFRPYAVPAASDWNTLLEERLPAAPPLPVAAVAVAAPLDQS